MADALGSRGIHTICQSARCPNVGECFGRGLATFLIMGDRCTRDCRFCAVENGAPTPLDPEEPARIAEAARRLGLKHIVVTSVTRDDLPDGGAAHFAAVVRALRDVAPEATVEILVPDFGGDRRALAVVVEAAPDVLGHNVETVPRLYPQVRRGASYARSLELLRRAKQIAQGCHPVFLPSTRNESPLLTKSGLMVGLGETQSEVEGVLRDLRAASVDILTIGQYLRPTKGHAAVAEYVAPEVFDRYRRLALDLGFREAACAPLVRSSYHAAEMVGRSDEE
jgi:lipoic acid synthetase